MRIAINQPTYLPWMGYFRMIERTDHFIFLDDVQFSKGSWQQKAKFPERTLNLHPERGPLGRAINQVKLKRSPRDHMEWINETYQASPLIDALQDIYAMDIYLLGQLNMELIHTVCGYLHLPEPQWTSSSLGLTGSNPTDRLVKICEHFGADTYLSPVGSRAYLDLPQFERAGIAVEWNVVPGEEGITGYSCVDALCKRKEGPES